MKDQKRGWSNVEDNETVEVATRDGPEVGHPALRILTWKCCYCRLSQLNLWMAALDLKGKTWEDRRQQEELEAEEAHRPSCCAPVEEAALLVGEASLTAASRDSDVEKTRVLSYYVRNAK